MTSSFVLAAIGGLMMGVYPAAIKTRAVVRARPHPVVFQLYKSFWVFVTGFLFLLPRYWMQTYSGSHHHVRGAAASNAQAVSNANDAHDPAEEKAP
eukprot:gene31962-34706_t